MSRPSAIVRGTGAAAAVLLLLTSIAGCAPTEAASDQPGADRLVFSSNAAPRTLDIGTVDDRNTDALLKPDVYEALTQMQYKSEDELEWAPFLATKWEQLAPTQWRFTIRPNVVFHDGSDLTADDVVYSVNRRLDPANEPTSTIANIQEAVKVDDMTVDIMTKTPDLYAFRSMSVISITPDGWGDDPNTAATTANGTGPYVLTSYTNGGNNALLTRFDDYWGEKAKIAEVEMRVIPEAATALSALQTGEINVLRDITPDLATKVPATLGVTSVQPLIGRIGAMNAPFDDVRVRQALNMAIDQKSLIESIYGGHAVPFNGQIIPPVALGYNPDVTDYKYDPEGAKALLEDAGAVGATVHIMCSPDRYGTAGADVCQAVGQMFDAIGLVSEITLAPTAQWTDAGMNAKKNGVVAPDVFIAGAGTEGLDGLTTLKAWMTCEAARNQLCDPAIVSAMNDAAALDDPAKRSAAIEAIEVMVKKAAPWVGILLPQAIWGATKGVDCIMLPTSENVRWASCTMGSE